MFTQEGTNNWALEMAVRVTGVCTAGKLRHLQGVECYISKQPKKMKKERLRILTPCT